MRQNIAGKRLSLRSNFHSLSVDTYIFFRVYCNSIISTLIYFKWFQYFKYVLTLSISVKCTISIPSAKFKERFAIWPAHKFRYVQIISKFISKFKLNVYHINGLNWYLKYEVHTHLCDKANINHCLVCIVCHFHRWTSECIFQSLLSCYPCISMQALIYPGYNDYFLSILQLEYTSFSRIFHILHSKTFLDTIVHVDNPNSWNIFSILVGSLACNHWGNNFINEGIY